MARQLCIILFIFFVTFFVSWWCTPELPVIFFRSSIKFK
jgi:hypothetical protein